MILVPKKATYKDILKQYEVSNEFTFENSEILPAEQSAVLIRAFNYNNRNKVKKAGGLTQEAERREKERIANGIVEKLQDPRLKEKGKLKSFLYSSGGSMSTSDKKEKENYRESGVKTAYTVMQINGIVILEPIGQAGNATYIAEMNDQLEENITKMGRGQALNKGVINKVIHDSYDKAGYNYESQHVLALLEYAIQSPQELMKVLKENESFCNLKTLTKRMMSVGVPGSDGTVTTGIDEAIEAIKLAMKEKGITKEEVLAQLKIELENEKTENTENKVLDKNISDKEDDHDAI